MRNDPNELVAELAVDGDSPENPIVRERPQTWEPPNLGETQRKIYLDDEAKYILCSGERGSGKSWIAAQKLVRHCYENSNALALVIVAVKRMAVEGGIFDRIERDILPMWKANIGLEYTETKTNTAKDAFIYVSNRYGGWSRILLLSMPVDSYIRERVRGMEPSFVLVDEIQTLASDGYFSYIVQQLGRRQGIGSVQQYVATCNPEGPSHWLYRRFFVMPIDKKTGVYNPDYATYHVSISENIQNLPDQYYSRVIEAVRDDPIEYQRMVLGIWVDRPSGSAIFKDYYSPAIHVRGSAVEETRILPRPGHPVIVGYDLGTANSAVVFLQEILTDKGSVWTVFDEAVYTEAHISYPVLVPSLLRRMNFWNETCKTVFDFQHISDNSAFNQFRATDGSYDYLEIERLSLNVIHEWPDLKPIIMTPAPKFSGSVSARVKTTMKLLNEERLFVSDSCSAVKSMFLLLESDKLKNERYDPSLPFTPKRSKHVHAFDALSYPLLVHELGNGPSNRAPMEFIGLGTKRAR